MVPDTHAPSEVSHTATDSTIVNALIGGIAGVVLSFIPLSTVLGGGIAGYLEGGSAEDGLKVGAVAGVVMLVPFTFIGVFLLFFLGFGGAPAALGLLGFSVLFFAAVYTVGLGVLGGYLGVYVRNET